MSEKRRRQTGWAMLAVVVLAWPGAGCGKTKGEMFVPVAGRVLLDGSPLAWGSISFHPDPKKGNPTMHIPVASIAADGGFTLQTIGKNGAPPGWYKVVVLVDAHEKSARITNSAAPPIPKWLMHERYTRPASTPLSIEVGANAPAPTYVLNVTSSQRTP